MGSSVGPLLFLFCVLDPFNGITCKISGRSYTKPRSDHQRFAAGDSSIQQVVIGNLSPEVTDFELKSLFAAHGEVISVNSLPLHHYAFVHFKEIEGLKLARQGV
ncbi:UNVERIFIED_CONTAM: hypothetical protein Sindi_2001400 [Sesamum indicum]